MEINHFNWKSRMRASNHMIAHLLVNKPTPANVTFDVIRLPFIKIAALSHFG